jgi:hypothetical protein
MAGMKLNLNRSLSLIGMVALCVGIAMSSVNATNTQNRDQEIQTVQSRQICAQEISSRQQCRAATTSEAPEKNGGQSCSPAIKPRVSGTTINACRVVMALRNAAMPA